MPETSNQRYDADTRREYNAKYYKNNKNKPKAERFKERLLQKQIKKRDGNYQVKITTYIEGRLKNNFFDDSINRHANDAELARNIIKLYYDVINIYPQLKGKEFSEISTFLISSLAKPITKV